MVLLRVKLITLALDKFSTSLRSHPDVEETTSRGEYCVDYTVEGSSSRGGAKHSVRVELGIMSSVPSCLDGVSDTTGDTAGGNRDLEQVRCVASTSAADRARQRFVRVHGLDGSSCDIFVGGMYQHTQDCHRESQLFWRGERRMS